MTPLAEATIPRRRLGRTSVEVGELGFGGATIGGIGGLVDELPACVERGVGIVIGAVFGSGLLATGTTPGARHNYREPRPAEIERVTRIKAICDRRRVPLATAAVQFPVAHPADARNMETGRAGY